MAAQEDTATHETTIVKIFVGVLIVISLIGIATLQPSRLDGWSRLALLGLLTGLASAWCVRIPGLRLELTPTDPFVLFAVATMDVGGAVFLAVVAVAGAAFWSGRRQRWVCHAFNFTALPLSAAVAALAYARMGGHPGMPISAALGPLAAATLIYLLANTGSAAIPIGLSGGKGLLRGWGRSLLWTLWPTLAALTLAVCMVVLVEVIGPLGLVLALPPVCALAALQQVEKHRFESRAARRIAGAAGEMA